MDAVKREKDGEREMEELVSMIVREREKGKTKKRKTDCSMSEQSSSSLYER